MARNFGKIESAFWQNHKVRQLSEDSRNLLQYIFTCPASTAAGTYVLPIIYITDELQWTEQRATKALHELSLKPYVLWDRTTRVLHIPGWWGHNTIENPNVAAHVVRLLLALPDCELKAMAINGLIKTGRFSKIIDAALGDWKLPESEQGSLGLALPKPQLQIGHTPEPEEAPTSKARGTRIPDDWYPDDEMSKYSISKGLSQSDIDSEVTKFIRYFTGPDAKQPVKKDWYRTWCNWIDKAAESKPSRNGNGHSNGNGHTQFGSPEVNWAVRVEGFRQRNFWVSTWGPKPGEPHCKVPAEFLAPVG